LIEARRHLAILSIQSSVAYGHVGNGAAVFPLQCLGFEVWPVNTVRFSNHPGYETRQGRIAEPAEVGAVIEGIGALGAFDRCRAVLSGYLGAAETASVVAEAVAAVKAANPGALYCCDPTMGDHEEGLYVPETLAAQFRDTLVGRADIIVPNAFELECLTGRMVTDEVEALAAADDILAWGPGMVVATSLPRAVDGVPGIGTLAASAAEAWLVTTPRRPLAAKGAGDVLAALFLGRYLLAGDMGAALADAVSSLFAVIEATVAANSRELLLVQCQEALRAPPKPLTAEKLR
jgi:pyridoxine kinase